MKNQVKFWILLGVIGTVIGVYIIFILMPIQKAIADTQSSITQTEREIGLSILRIRQIPEMRRHRDRLKSGVESLQKRILPPDSISSAMSQLKQVSAQYGVTISTMNFSTDSLLSKSRSVEAGSNESFELPVLFEFEGRFLDIGMMIEHIHRLSFIISFTDFRMSSLDKSDKVKLEARACVRVAASMHVQKTAR